MNYLNNLGKFCIFISPHLDDVILSCYQTIKRLQNSKKNILIITVFTKGSNPPYSKNALWLMKKSGFTNSDEYFKARKLENSKAVNRMGITHINLNFIEAPFRKSYHFKTLYPNFKSLFNYDYKETMLTEKVKNKVIKTIRNKIKNKDFSIFLPFGIGNHVDHIITNNALTKLTKKTYFWEDFPYNKENKLVLKYRKNLKLLTSLPPTTQKFNIIKQYKTQYYSLFPKNIFPKVFERIWGHSL